MQTLAAGPRFSAPQWPENTSQRMSASAPVRIFWLAEQEGVPPAARQFPAPLFFLPGKQQIENMIETR